MTDEYTSIDYERLLDKAIHHVKEGHGARRNRLTCPRCKKRIALGKEMLQRILGEALTEIRGRWLTEFTEEHKKMLTVMQERYEAEYEQKVHESQEQYDKKIEHGIKEDMANKFESLMSDAITEKIAAYKIGVEEIAKRLEDLSKKLSSMDFVENPFEGDELFQEGEEK